MDSVSGANWITTLQAQTALEGILTTQSATNARSGTDYCRLNFRYQNSIMYAPACSVATYNLGTVIDRHAESKVDGKRIWFWTTALSVSGIGRHLT